MFAYLAVGSGKWSIADVDTDGDILWWCGDKHEWVATGSWHWEVNLDCWNVEFSSLRVARRFARSRGWEGQ